MYGNYSGDVGGNDDLELMILWVVASGAHILAQLVLRVL
eukprot:SAG31_NODE_3794_length_3876_cov_2.497485_6_plen_39_part_00